MARSSVDHSLNALDVGLPGTVGTSVRVGNLDTKGHALATKITLSHFVCTSYLEINQLRPRRRLDMIPDFFIKSKLFFIKILLFLICC
jgi:hypothetical protein